MGECLLLFLYREQLNGDPNYMKLALEISFIQTNYRDIEAICRHFFLTRVITEVTFMPWTINAGVKTEMDF